MALSAPLSIVDRDTVTVGNTAGNPVPVSDGGGSVTVDNPTLSVVGTGTASGAQRVHLSDESLAALENITVQVGEVEIKNDSGSPVPISAAALPLPTGAATEAKQLPDNHQVRVSNFPATQVVSATDLDIRNLSSAQDSVNVGNFPATQQVSGTVALDSASLAALETISVANFPATQTVSATDLDIRNLTAAQDTVASRDIYTAGETLADQATAGSVATFTFSTPVQLVYVYGASTLGQNTYRADPFGGTPSASQGIPCPDGVATAIPVQTSVIRVFGASGTVSVWGFRY